MSHVRRTLGRRTYIGESQHGETVNRNAHEALTDRITWQRAQSKPGRRQASAIYPLSGIATCAGCGGPMVGGRGGPNIRTYRCTNAACTSRSTTIAERLELYARDYLRKKWNSEGWTSATRDDSDLTGTKLALEAAEEELDSFATDLEARRRLGRRYHTYLQARIDAVEQAEAACRAEAAKHADETRAFPAELLDTDDPSELRELFEAAFAGVIVTKGRGPIENRARPCWHKYPSMPAA
jgi:hypothetical protein